MANPMFVQARVVVMCFGTTNCPTLAPTNTPSAVSATITSRRFKTPASNASLFKVPLSSESIEPDYRHKSHTGWSISSQLIQPRSRIRERP